MHSRLKIRWCENYLFALSLVKTLKRNKFSSKNRNVGNRDLGC